MRFGVDEVIYWLKIRQECFLLSLHRFVWKAANVFVDSTRYWYGRIPSILLWFFLPARSLKLLERRMPVRSFPEECLGRLGLVSVG